MGLDCQLAPGYYMTFLTYCVGIFSQLPYGMICFNYRHTDLERIAYFTTRSEIKIKIIKHEIIPGKLSWCVFLNGYTSALRMV